MKVTNEKIENSQAFLTIEMDSAEMEKSLEESYHCVVKKTKVPGFRKGKAPRPVLERYIGKESLLEEALDHLIPEAYAEAIKEQEIEAFAQPHIEITQTDPLVFKATVPLEPEVKLEDYHLIQVNPEDVTELTDEDVSAAIEQLRHQYATWEPVERQVGLDDLVILDVESHIEDKPFINQKGVQYQVSANSSSPVAGFAEQLLGMKKDEEKEFKLQFPDDYSKDELAGKEPVFKVKLAEIKQERLPELNDEFAREVNSNFDSLDSLRNQVATALRLESERKAGADFEEKVLDAVVDIAQVEFPPILAEAEINHLINQQLQRGQMSREGLDEYLGRINKTEKELRKELYPVAIKRIIRSLVLGKIAEDEKVTVGDTEIDAEIENMIQGDTEKKDELQKYLDTPQFRTSIEQILITRKTIQQLIEIAKGSSSEPKVKVKPKKGGKND
ncbi:trigger factor [Chloroflexota bacterium]